MRSLDCVSSAADAGSGAATLDVRAAFCVATIDSGLLLALSGDWDAGRLCQDRGLVPGVEDAALVGLERRSGAASSSLVGDVEMLLIGLSMVSSGASGCGTGLSRTGEDVRLRRSAGREARCGVFAGDDFWGDMDLARSEFEGTRGQLGFSLQKEDETERCARRGGCLFSSLHSCFYPWKASGSCVH